jgi:uncharacterized membrane protein/nitrite reductase/ring-hydroxylating ferredoxin subunit
MKTIAHVKGHAIHQMLIPFPIGFLTGALVSDIVAQVRDDPFWSKMAAYLALAGIATALLAAVPGLIDFLWAVPPNSSAKKRATYHLVVNVSAVALFVIAWLVRRDGDFMPGWLGVALELAGGGLMTMGGWLGGTLVNRNFIGPEHRYAHAGKWKEQTFDASPGKPVEVAKVDELKENQMKLLRVGDKRIVLARTDKGYCAFSDSCAHRGGSLADGVMICGTVQCLWHGSQYDVKTGQVKAGPAEKGIETYRVEESGGTVKLTLP